MPASNVSSRARELRRQIARHDKLYYGEAQPEITDREYDTLLRELVDLEAAHPDLSTPDSPTRRVAGKPLGGFQQVRHRVPMQSLDNTYSLEEANEFMARVERLLPGIPLVWTIEPKVDGVALSLTYRGGLLELAATRGDGATGDDVTQNIRTIRSIPLKLEGKVPELIEIRGEVYLPKKKFSALNTEREKKGEALFANPRNAAAGTLKLLDSSVVARRGLSAVFYGLGAVEGGKAPQTQAELLRWLKIIGLPVVPKFWEAVDEAGVRKAIAALESIRHDFAFETDGAVIKLDAFKRRDQAGTTSKAPRWAMAYKYEAERARTRLRDITVQVGRTGTLTPVAELEPVQIAGSRVARATLHNEEEIARKDIRIGDWVFVEKAGEVIPAVVGVDLKARTGKEKKFKMPDKCPSCHTTVIRTPGEVAWRCENINCSAQKTRRLEFFAQRAALDIESIGGIVADKLVETGFVDEPLDLFKLNSDKLASLNLGSKDEPRMFGSKNAEKALKAIQHARELPLNKWIFALAIPRVGSTTAFVLAKLHKDFRDFSDSEIIKDFLRMHELLEQAAHINPDSRGSQDAAVRKAQDNVIRGMSQAERAREHMRLNGEIEVLAKKLESAGVQIKVTKKEKKKGNPPVLSITSELEHEACGSVAQYFSSAYGKRLAKRLADLGINPTMPKLKKRGSHILEGKTIVLTGSLETISRKEAEDLIRAAGGTVGTSVGKKTSYLVTGANPGSKLKDAEKLQIPHLTESKFLKLVGRPGTTQLHGSHADQQGELF